QALSLVDTLVVSADVDSCLSLRAGPSKKERAVDCLAAGTRASAVDAVADWILVRLRDDRRGWVSAAYLEPASSRELRETREAESRSRAAAVEAERSSAAATTAQQQSDAERARLSDALEASRAETAAMRTQFGIRISELDGALKQVRAENEQLKAEVGEKRLAALSLLGDDEVTVLAEPCLRLRAAASVEGRQIDCLAKGTRARVVDLLEGWTRLELADGRVGWTSAGFLEPVRREEERKSAARLVVVEEAHRNLEKDTQSLKAERDDLDRKLTNLRLESARFEAELASLRQAEGRATALEGELATARETLSATEKGGTELRARLLELETERDQLRGTLEREKSQGAEAVATLAEARSETESARSEASMLRERVAELESMSSASAELEQQLETMRNQLAASEDGRQKQAALIEEIERARGELAVRLEVIDSERQTLASRTEAAEIERAAAAAALTAARHELARVEEVERPAAIESEDLEVPSEVAEVAASMERAPDVGDLEAVARAWAAAWSEQRVADYLYFYSSDFLPANGMSRSAWEDLRRRRVSAPESIEVELSDLTVRIDANGDASVTFSQAYRSNTFADQVLKTLELVREDGLWKIRSEQTQ
ncbi:MAG: SH3 domain-containing protein, partial [Acidobacteriota bacterium]|nr:SH3 domain-containing protein [Acidobacteriota bacterium]